jgi:hypothetical protein
MWQKILVAYINEYIKDLKIVRRYWRIVSDDRGKWLQDWVEKRSFLRIIFETIIILPWKLAIWWPFLTVYYIWNGFIRYTLLPLLVITEDYKYLYNLVYFIEKFLRTFFGLFWITEFVPYMLKKKKEKWSKKIDKFGNWANNFQIHGPEMVDNYFARKRYDIWSWYDSYIKWPLFLFNRKYPVRRIIRRKKTTIKALIRWYIRNIPHYLTYKKQLWIYRIKVIMIWCKPTKIKTKILLTKLAQYTFLFLWFCFITLQGFLLTLEIIFIPERFSLWIRRKIRNVKNKIIIYLTKKEIIGKRKK